MKRPVVVLLSALVLLAAFAGGALVFRAQHAEEVASLSQGRAELFIPDYALRYGDPAAKVTIVEFFDPACETCAQFAPIVKNMVDGSNGRIQLVLRYAPFHAGSPAVVALLEGSRAQDRYWQTLDVLFETQSSWSQHDNPRPDRIWGFLQQAGIDVGRLAEDMKDPAIEAHIQQDIADARTLGVTATPEYFVNGKPLPTWGLQQLKDLVASELAAAY